MLDWISRIIRGKRGREADAAHAEALRTFDEMRAIRERLKREREERRLVSSSSDNHHATTA